MKKVAVIGFQLIAICATAQVGISWQKDTTSQTIRPGGQSVPDTNIRVYMPAFVANTENKIYEYQRYNHGTSPGFRVQINFGQDRNAMNQIQAGFSGRYPGTPTYVSYKQPYFRLSAGDFRTRLEAVSFLNKVRRDYPGAFVVSERIVPPPL